MSDSNNKAQGAKNPTQSLISCLSNLYEENKLKLAALGHICTHTQRDWNVKWIL